MSEYIFKLPDLGEGTVESEIGEWLVKVGDEVREEDIVGTVMTDKAAVEVSSPGLINLIVNQFSRCENITRFLQHFVFSHR